MSGWWVLKMKLMLSQLSTKLELKLKLKLSLAITSELLLIWPKIPRTNVTVTVDTCYICSQKAYLQVWSISGQ